MRFLRHDFTDAQRAKILRLAEEKICLRVQAGCERSIEESLISFETGNLTLKQMIEEEQNKLAEKLDAIGDKYNRLWEPFYERLDELREERKR